ncbi:MAG: hypothetical protein GY950_19725 [bacterium]|nr:hypothetical protein [bacterium]
MKRNLKTAVFSIFAFLVIGILLLNGKAIVTAAAAFIFSGNPIANRFDIAYLSGFILAAALLILVLKQGFSKYDITLFKGIKEKAKTFLPLPPLSPKFLFIGASLVILLYFAPYIFSGQDTHVKIFDVLDAWVPQAKILAESGKALSLDTWATVDNLTNGLRLSGFNSGYNISTWLFMIFNPFTAFTLNLLITAFTAFWGMALLLKKYIIKSGEYNWLIIGPALCFALLTFYPPAGISIAGFPLLLYCFLEIKNREWKIRHFIFVFLFPFYSLMHHAGLFILILLGVIFLMDFVKTRRFHIPYFVALALLSLTYVFTHFHLIYSIFDPAFVSAREEIFIDYTSFRTCLKHTIGNFIFDKTNVVSAQQLFILPTAAAALIVLIARKQTQRLSQLMFLVLAALGNAFLWGFKYWEGIAFIREEYPFFNTFNIARFFWLNPAVWYIIFAVSLAVISKLKHGKAIASVLIVGQLLFMFYSYNLEYRYRTGQRSKMHSSLTYRQFFSEELFNEIADHIGKPKKDYRTVSLGIHPGIAQYNGFHTLDLYSTVYPLEYKHQFREIFAKELEKSPLAKRTFDGNGKRCYLMAAELHGNRKFVSIAFSRGVSKKDKRIKIENLELNTTALKAMGGEYIFSGVPIVNHEATGLTFEKRFKSQQSPWRIYLYKVK